MCLSTIGDSLSSTIGTTIYILQSDRILLGILLHIKDSTILF